jgi:hypothetical protein
MDIFGNRRGQPRSIDAALADELERHGVHVAQGARVRLQLLPVESMQDERPARLPDSFIGRWTSPEPDLSERAKPIARAEMA